ncbi:MAG: general secretion pathway protein GspK [Bacteriovoracia bacterium]
MGFPRAFSDATQRIRARIWKRLNRPVAKPEGMALFMVLSAVAILSLLVTEFTYVSQVNRKMAYDSVDQLQAFYTAKSALKISLLRLKAYQNVKNYIASAGASVPVPKNVIELIWTFPLIFPIPTSVPGLSDFDKERIQKFQDDSNIKGSYTASIESESSRYNLNMLLQTFIPADPSPSPSPTPTQNPDGTTSTPTPTPTPTSTDANKKEFDPAAARKNLFDFLSNILRAKIDADEDFAREYRDFNLAEMLEGVYAWADRSYQAPNRVQEAEIPPKRMPFFSVSELHMIPGFDDKLFDLFSPALTASTTPGINVNTMKAVTLRALVPGITDEEVKDFFTYRDSQEEDHLFKTVDDFLTYLQKNVAIFRNDADETKEFKQELEKKGIRLVTDETEFKITVQATVEQASRSIEAWVALSTPKSTGTGSNPAPTPTPSQVPGAPAGTPPKPDPGLKVLFMRFL